MKKSKNGKRQCTCKLLSWNLSANTAAEYGDLGSLAHRLSKTTQKSNTRDAHNSASTPSLLQPLLPSQPLHLAAQHGHISITSYLLSNGYDANSGLPSTTDGDLRDKEDDEHSNTPLHRACYSGAIGCMKLLLERDASVLTPDMSFGDGMSPLHKAVKGGRYLAVALLVQHCRNPPARTPSDLEPRSDLLSQILHAKDSSNRSPLQLALELDSKGEEEILSLRRWDSIAGGPADFRKCVELLQDASDSIPRGAMDGSPTELDDESNALKEDDFHKKSFGKETLKQKGTVSSSPSLWTNFCECDNGDGTQCKTAVAWESIFLQGILDSTAHMICASAEKGANTSVTNSKDTRGNDTATDTDTITRASMIENLNESNSIHDGTNSCKEMPASISAAAQTLPPSEPLGHPCQFCNTICIAFFRTKDGNLACRKCSRRRRRGFR